MKYFLLVLFILSAANASELEDYFGKYQSPGKPNQLAFRFANSNITDLVVNGVAIKDGVTFDILGIFEGSMVLRIDYADSNKQQCVIRALIHNEGKKFVVASGFFVAFRLDSNNQPDILRTFTFELKRNS